MKRGRGEEHSSNGSSSQVKKKLLQITNPFETPDLANNLCTFVNLTDLLSNGSNFQFKIPLDKITHLKITQSQELTNKLFEELANKLVNLESLDLRDCTQITAEVFLTNLHKLKNLTQLTLGAGEGSKATMLLSYQMMKLLFFGKEQIKDFNNLGSFFVNPTSKLKTLSIYNSQISFCKDINEYKSLNFPSLEHLHLSGCEGITDNLLNKTLSLFPNLKTLQLSNCPGIKKDQIKTLISNKRINLNVTECNLSPQPLNQTNVRNNMDIK